MDRLFVMLKMLLVQTKAQRISDWQLYTAKIPFIKCSPTHCLSSSAFTHAQHVNSHLQREAELGCQSNGQP